MIYHCIIVDLAEYEVIIQSFEQTVRNKKLEFFQLEKNETIK